MFDLVQCTLRATPAVIITYGKLWSQRSSIFFDAFRVLYFSRIVTVYMFLRLHKSSSVLNSLSFFHGQHIPRIYLSSSMSGKSLVGDLLVQLVKHTMRMNFGFKSEPSGMPFPRITYRACLIQCYDVYRLSSLSVADTQSTDFRCFLFFFFVNLIVYLYYCQKHMV